MSLNFQPKISLSPFFFFAQSHLIHSLLSPSGFFQHYFPHFPFWGITEFWIIFHRCLHSNFFKLRVLLLFSFHRSYHMSSAIKYNSKCGFKVMDLIFIDFQEGGRNLELPTCLNLNSTPLISSRNNGNFIHYSLMNNMLFQIKYFHKYIAEKLKIFSLVIQKVNTLNFYS